MCIECLSPEALRFKPGRAKLHFWTQLARESWFQRHRLYRNRRKVLGRCRQHFLRTCSNRAM
jgi:hypothetical protein